MFLNHQLKKLKLGFSFKTKSYKKCFNECSYFFSLNSFHEKNIFFLFQQNYFLPSPKQAQPWLALSLLNIGCRRSHRRRHSSDSNRSRQSWRRSSCSQIFQKFGQKWSWVNTSFSFVSCHGSSPIERLVQRFVWSLLHDLQRFQRKWGKGNQLKNSIKNCSRSKHFNLMTSCIKN